MFKNEKFIDKYSYKIDFEREKLMELKRILDYKGEIIEYTLIKSKIKNLYIIIKDGNVIVKAPNRVSQKEAKDFIQKKANWILKKLKEEKNKKEEKEVTKEEIEELKRIIDESVKKYCNKFGLWPNKVRIRDIKYAWGSCSGNKNITISLKLAGKERKIIEYVVLHEICHLKYMNHSKLFWNLVQTEMPDYKIYRKKLK